MENKFKDCIDQAERFLALREHNRKELSEKLKNKGFDQEIIEKTLIFLSENDELSEQRYVRSFIRSNNKRHPEGPGVMLNRLALKGTDKNTAKEITKEVYTEENILKLASECFEKITAKTTDVQKIRYKMVRSGFSLSVANKLINENRAR